MAQNRNAMCFAVALTVSFLVHTPMLFAQVEITGPASQVVKAGDAVQFSVVGKGKLGMESSFTKQSSEIDVSSGVANLGKATRGFHFVRLIEPNGDSHLISLLLTPTDDNSGLLIDSSVTKVTAQEMQKVLGDSAMPVDPGFPQQLLKFVESITKEELQQAANEVIGPWLALNASSLQQTAVTCTICIVPNPASPFACPVCTQSAVGNIGDLGADIVIKIVQMKMASGKLLESTGKSIISGITFGKGLASVIAAEGRLQKSLEIANILTEITIDNPIATGVVKHAKDQYGSAIFLIKLGSK